MKAPDSYRWTPKLQREFLEQLATTGSVKIAAAMACMSPSAAYRLKLRPQGKTPAPARQSSHGRKSLTFPPHACAPARIGRVPETATPAYKEFFISYLTSNPRRLFSKLSRFSASLARCGAKTGSRFKAGAAPATVSGERWSIRVTGSQGTGKARPPR